MTVYIINLIAVLWMELTLMMTRTNSMGKSVKKDSIKKSTKMKKNGVCCSE